MKNVLVMVAREVLKTGKHCKNKDKLGNAIRDRFMHLDVDYICNLHNSSMPLY